MSGGLRIEAGLMAVVLAVTDDRPRVLTVVSDPPRLPAGPLDPASDRTLERALRRWVGETTGLDLGYVEQLYTYGDAGRGGEKDVRQLAIAYLGLVREGPLGGQAEWRDLYEFLPWEDRRQEPGGVPPAVGTWVIAAENESRRQRAAMAWGGVGSWDPERALERYELLFEVGVLPEAGGEGLAGLPMGLDHRRVLAQALGRLRGKLQYRPVVFELMPSEFTLSALQRVVEAVVGRRLHTGNFRRLLERTGMVEGLGRRDAGTGGRPAELHRFRRQVVLERPAPGVGLPGMRTSG
ncbi:MAG: hypothetical protein QY307_07640 [Acidimicrobiia bacterium]|nr:MAG: hypothetical protein QY307_07640 [Acidimicrobiia bacterium]